VVFHTVSPALAEDDAAECRYDFQRYGIRVLRALERLHAESPFGLIEFPDYWAEGHAAIRARREAGVLDGARLVVRLHTHDGGAAAERGCGGGSGDPGAHAGGG
jgi:hypothetical protein